MVLFYYLLFIISKCKFGINKKALLFGLKLSVPLILHVLSHRLLSTFDRIVLNEYYGSSLVGLYGFAYNVGLLMSIITQALNNAWFPWFLSNMKQNNLSLINKNAKKYIFIVTLITIVVIYISPEIGKLMAPKEYWSALKIIPLVILGYYFIFLASFPVNIQYYIEKTIFISVGTILAAGSNVILNILFIPKYGIIAAALTTTISYFVLFIFHTLLSSTFIRKMMII